MTQFPRPCLICNQLTSLGNYCVIHKQQRDQMEATRQATRRKTRTLYRSTQYRTAALHIKNTATHCHLCGQAFNNREEITADHLEAGNPNSALAPAHRSCNSARGNKPLT
jgi:hypothetical protein